MSIIQNNLDYIRSLRNGHKIYVNRNNKILIYIVSDVSIKTNSSYIKAKDALGNSVEFSEDSYNSIIPKTITSLLTKEEYNDEIQLRESEMTQYKAEIIENFKLYYPEGIYEVIGNTAIKLKIHWDVINIPGRESYVHKMQDLNCHFTIDLLNKCLTKIDIFRGSITWKETLCKLNHPHCKYDGDICFGSDSPLNFKYNAILNTLPPDDILLFLGMFDSFIKRENTNGVPYVYLHKIKEISNQEINRIQSNVPSASNTLNYDQYLNDTISITNEITSEHYQNDITPYGILHRIYRNKSVQSIDNLKKEIIKKCKTFINTYTFKPTLLPIEDSELTPYVTTGENLLNSYQIDMDDQTRINSFYLINLVKNATISKTKRKTKANSQQIIAE